MERFGNALLCDAIYQDRITNKMVLAGVYSGSISLSEIPSAFNASLYSEYWPETIGLKEIDVQFLIGGDLIGGAKIALVIGDLSLPAILIVPNFHFAVQAPGQLVVQAVTSDGRTLSLFSKNVDLKSSTASPPPSSRSRPAPRTKASKP